MTKNRQLLLIFLASFLLLPGVFADAQLAITQINTVPAEPQPDENAVIEVHIENIGDETSNEFDVTVHTIWGGYVPYSTKQWFDQTPLAPQETRVYSYHFVFDHNGNWEIPGGAKEEGNPQGAFKIIYFNIGPIVTDPSISELIVFPFPDNNRRFFIATKTTNKSNQWHSPGSGRIDIQSLEWPNHDVRGFGLQRSGPFVTLGYPSVFETTFDGNWEFTTEIHPYNVDANLENNIAVTRARTGSGQPAPYFIDLYHRVQLPPNPFYVGYSYQIPFESTNLGNFDMGAYYQIDVNVTSPSGQTTQILFYSHRLQAGETIENNIQFSPTEDGIWTISFNGWDIFHSIDSNIANNHGTVQILVERIPAPNILFSEPLKVINIQDTTYLRIKVSNDGNPIPWFTTAIRGSGSDPESMDYWGFSLEPNEVREINVPLNFVDQNRLITVSLDYFNEISESNELDNNASITVRLPPLQSPNFYFPEPLAVVDINGTQHLRMRYAVESEIAIEGMQGMIAGLRQNPGDWIFPLFGLMEPGQVYEAVFPVQFIDTNRLVTVSLDYWNRFLESNENDNNAFIYISNPPQALPNLIIKQIVVSHHFPTPFATPQNEYVLVTVKNIGEAAAGPSTLKIEVISPSAIDPNLMPQFLPTRALQPGEQTTLKAQYKHLPKKPAIIAITDYFNVVNESNENDNIGRYP